MRRRRWSARSARRRLGISSSISPTSRSGRRRSSRQLGGGQALLPVPRDQRTGKSACPPQSMLTIETDGAPIVVGGERDVLDARGCVVVPGIVDVHTHLIGGSGENGFASATPPPTAKELLDAGITTADGTLG